MREYILRTIGNVLLAGVALGAIGLSGCGSKLPTVEGTVTLDGDPVPEARVVFESPDSPTATAKTDASGHYDMRTASERGMAAGPYKVSVSAYKTKDGGTESPMPILTTPKIYNSIETSGLTAEISDGSNTVDFELTSKKK